MADIAGIITIAVGVGLILGYVIVKKWGDNKLKKDDYLK